jgi:hypothetical protein
MSGCSFTRSTSSKNILAPENSDKAVLLPVKFYAQEKNKCGVTALRAVLEFYGVEYTDLDSVFNEELNATRLISIVNYANRYLHTNVDRLSYDAVVDSIRRGDPIIILLKSEGFNHYAVVKGVIESEREIVVNDGYNENVVLSYEGAEAKSNDSIAIIFTKKKNKEVANRNNNIINLR